MEKMAKMDQHLSDTVRCKEKCNEGGLSMLKVKRTSNAGEIIMLKMAFLHDIS